MLYSILTITSPKLLRYNLTTRFSTTGGHLGFYQVREGKLWSSWLDNVIDFLWEQHSESIFSNDLATTDDEASTRLMRLNALENTFEGIVLLNDIDVNGHMNNGRFMTVCDLNRIDLFIRTGLARIMLRRKWMPIISFHDMNYYKSFKLGQRYRCSMSMERWDEKYFYMRHKFTNPSGATVAEGVSRAVIRGRDGVIPPEEVVAAVEAYQRLFTEELL